MSGIRIRLDALLAKIEGTYGTDAVPVAADDGVRLSERVWSNLRIEHAFDGDRRDVTNSSAIVEAQPAPRIGRTATLEIAWDARGAGATYVSNDHEAHALMRACGLTATLATDEYNYTIADSGYDSVTLYAYAGGSLYKIVGTRGNMRWPITAGGLGTMRFVMQGTVTDISTAALPSVTYDATLPQPAAGMTFTLGAWSPDVYDAEFDLGAQVQRLDSVQDTEGIDEFDIAQFEPTLRVNARSVALGTFDPYSDARTPTARAVAVILGATGSYNSFELADAAGYVMDPEHPEDQGMTAWSLTYRLSDPTLTAAN